jgi:endonuclease YncB( thermonuclease family)
MPYGKEAKEELVKLVQGRTLKISLYDTDRYGRMVGDVECNGVFVQVGSHTAFLNLEVIIFF